MKVYTHTHTNKQTLHPLTVARLSFSVTFVFPGICSAILSQRLSVPLGKWRRAHSKMTCWFWVHVSPSFPPSSCWVLPSPPPPSPPSLFFCIWSFTPLTEVSLEGIVCGISSVLSAVLGIFVGLWRRLAEFCCGVSVSAVASSLSAVVMMLSLMCWFFLIILVWVLAKTLPEMHTADWRKWTGC